MGPKFLYRLELKIITNGISCDEIIPRFYSSLAKKPFLRKCDLYLTSLKWRYFVLVFLALQFRNHYFLWKLELYAIKLCAIEWFLQSGIRRVFKFQWYSNGCVSQCNLKSWVESYFFGWLKTLLASLTVSQVK